ncbi:metallophosphoesterase family protein [Hymenobacter terricola]|uniref:hypothetical protein n=1 Tax=Hymenobacter terricola TaxID=2819236 RepID=UPI001B313D22|nr:hypothetical protein [Hymenobacter terricola]
MRLLWLVACCLLGSAFRCPAGAGAAPPPSAYTVFLVGGTGVGTDKSLTATLALLHAQLQAAGPQSTVILLGDNLSDGLPGVDKPQRPAAQNRLLQVLDLLKGCPGRLVMVPGGEDWERGGSHGWQRVKAQEKFVEEYLGRGDVFIPSNGCPGPVEIALDARHTLVVLDTQWWLHAWDKPGIESACEAKDEAAVVLQLDDLLGRNQGKNLLVVGHRPLVSVKNSVWQEVMPNPRRRIMNRSLLQVLEKYPGLTYASGHDRSLSYCQKNGLHYLGSGAAALATNVAPSAQRTFEASTAGFVRLDYVADGAVKATFWSPAVLAAGGLLHEEQWVEPCVARELARDTIDVFNGLVAHRQASTRYRAGKLRTWLQGTNYRREWQQVVPAPVLDLRTAYGGLVPMKRGGGLQTKSLRLRAANGTEYVLRSIDKTTDSSVPAYLRHTLAADIVQDQISAAHPYAALAVAPLAEAAGVGHTTPRLVLVPDDPRLGPFRTEFAGSLALLEAREPAPPRNFAGQPTAKNYSTEQVLDLLRASQRNHVDERALLRARLFDLVIADWDRHEDQWRWLAYPQPDGGLLFRAVPRDRDEAFFVNEGVLPHLASAEYLLPKLQGFDTDFRNVNSFNYQARYFDRSFLTELPLADWLALADTLQLSLTDAVLERALRQWPDSIYRLSGPQVLAKLRAHRNQLKTWTAQYYRFLARQVDVLGSDEREYFEVKHEGEDRSQVNVFAIKANGQRGQALYQRTFWASETEEIRLYGQGGADVFVLSGTSRAAPLVRIIGGAGADTLVDHSQVHGWGHKTKVYDVPDGISIIKGPETATRLSRLPAVNAYNWASFQYPYVAPLYPISYNVDDGLFIGLGVRLKHPGFRKEPWAATQVLTGSVALGTGAFNFHYEGLFTHAIRKLDLRLEANLEAPNYVHNYYGLGNETLNDPAHDRRYYQVRVHNLSASALLWRAVGTRLHVFGGPVYQRIAIEDQPERIVAQQVEGHRLPATVYAPKQYAGGRVGFEVVSPDAKAAWPQGIKWQTDLLVLRPLNTISTPLTQLTSTLALYRSFRYPVRLTLAFRVGGTANFGDYFFLQAATLGGLTNLRGYRRTRFAGTECAFNNLEARLELGHLTSYVLPATFGVLGFHDLGRVWLASESSTTWHRGYGGGLWVAPIPQVLLAAMYGISKEDRLPLVRLGYFF